MRKLFYTFIILLAIGAAGYKFRPEFHKTVLPFTNIVNQFVIPKSPCDTPIPYTLGSFDDQFGLSQADFLSAIAEAEAVWDKPEGKQLFAYEPTSQVPSLLKINLVYDYRQQAASKLKSIGLVVNNDKASYDMLKAKYDSMQGEYQNEKNLYDTTLSTFNATLDDYNKQVAYWNAQGGAPKEEYDKLNMQKDALNTATQNLKNTEAMLNSNVSEINSLVVVLNQLVSSLNLSVDQYNTVNGVLGDSFEEGLYVSEGLARHIDIYEFTSKAKLVRVLAHELGHALGFAHISDSKAIMYKFNNGTSLTPTAADLSLLTAHCGS